MGSVTLWVVSTNSTHEFFIKKTFSPWNSEDMRSMKLEMAYTNSTHELIPVTSSQCSFKVKVISFGRPLVQFYP